MTPQQIASLKNDLLADKFSKALNEQMFPVEKLSDIWKILASKGIKITSPLKSRLSLMEFAKMISVKIQGPLTLFQFGILSNSIEELSYSDVVNRDGIGVGDYIDALTEASEHIKYYNSQIKIIQERIQKEVEEEVKLRLAVSDNGGILKPVKGEA